MTHDELVEKMESAYKEGGMSAVLSVGVEELLGDMRTASDEWALIAAWVPERSIYMASWADVNLLLKNRRASYSPPKPKTLEERVELKQKEQSKC